MSIWIAWALAWFPSWLVSWLALVLAIVGLAGFVWGRFTLLPYANLVGLLGPIALLVAAFLFGIGSAQSVEETLRLQERNDAQAAQIEILNDRIALERKLRADDAERARLDAELNQKNEEQANETPPNDNVALPRDAARRVRDIH